MKVVAVQSNILVVIGLKCDANRKVPKNRSSSVEVAPEVGQSLSPTLLYTEATTSLTVQCRVT